MWNIASVIAAIGVLFIVDGRPLMKAKKSKELWLFSLLMLGATVLGILQATDLTLPSPIDLISMLLNPISNDIARFAQ